MANNATLKQYINGVWTPVVVGSAGPQGPVGPVGPTGMPTWESMEGMPRYLTMAGTVQLGYWNQFISAVRGSGSSIYYDEDFNDGANSLGLYNNNGGSALALTHVNAASAGISPPPNSSGNVIKIAYTPGSAETSPGWGGFVQPISAAANKTFVQVFQALIPAGFSVYNAENSMGANALVYWITSAIGTGKWEWYCRVVRCGDSGSFSVGGHVYISGGPTGAFEWYLASCNCFEISNRATSDLYNLTLKGNQVLHAGNYSAYTPTKTGAGASGTWGIGITGNAGTVNGQNFSWANNDDNPQYIWNASVNGNAQLTDRRYMWTHGMVNHADVTHPFKAGFTTAAIQNPGGSWGKMCMVYDSNGQTYGMRVDYADYADSATSIWGFNNPAVGATPSSIAYRDGNGDIAARIFRMSSATGDAAPVKLLNMQADGSIWSTSAAQVAAFLSGQTLNVSAGSTSLLSPLGAYAWSAASLPNSFNDGIQTSFVNSESGFPNYGTLIVAKGYTGNGGGTLQMYVPYSPNFGGNSLKVRFGNYDAGGNVWTGWKTLIDSESIGSQSVSSAVNFNTGSGAYSSDGSLYGVEVYASNWFRSSNSLTGLYNTANANHIYSRSGSDWVLTGSGGSTAALQIRMNHEGTLAGYLYGEISGNFGLLNDIGGWAVRCNPGNSYGGSLYGSWVATGNISANNLSGTNTGDQTNISGNSATTSRLYTAEYDGSARAVWNTAGSYYVGFSGNILNGLSLVQYNSATAAAGNAVASYPLLHAGNIGSYTSGSATELLSKYYYTGTEINDGTTALALSPGVGSTTVAMHNTHGRFGGYATTLTMSGYERYGASQLSVAYNEVTPRLAFRNYNQAAGTWNTWAEVVHSGTIGSQTVATAGNLTGHSAGYAYADGGTADTANYLNTQQNRVDVGNYQLGWLNGPARSMVYGTAACFINPSTGSISATHFKGSGNVGGTGEAIHCPSGVYSQGTNWLYGPIETSHNSINAGSGSVTAANFYGNFSNGSVRSSGGQIFADTYESAVTNDWIEMCYSTGYGVRIGVGSYGSKPLYGSGLYDDGNRVYSGGNPQTNIAGSAAYLNSKSSDAFHQRVRYATTAGNGGYYKINIVPTGNWMLSFIIRIYQDYQSYDIRVSGYQYNGNYWYQPQASLIDSNDTSITVTFGYDSVNNLWVAVPAGSYTGIEIVSIVNGYSQVDQNWSTGFTITNVATLANVQTSIVTYRPAKYNEVIFTNDARLTDARAANGGTSAACSGNSATATVASTLGVTNNGSTAFTWSDPGGQTTYVWGTTNGADTHLVYLAGSSVNYANSAGGCSGTAYLASAVSYVLNRTDGEFYQALWGAPYSSGSGTVAYSCAGVKIRSSDGTMSASHFEGNANVAGTGNAIHCPSGIFSQGSNWLYGEIETNGNSINSGAITSSGNVTAYSDERLKTNWRPFASDFVERLAQVKNGIYDRIDGEHLTQVGVSAQSLQRMMPNAIITATDDMRTLSVAYGNAALAAAVELAKEVVDLKAQLAELRDFVLNQAKVLASLTS